MLERMFAEQQKYVAVRDEEGREKRGSRILCSKMWEGC